MQKISLSSLRISEPIENPRPTTHKRRLFSRFALGMIGENLQGAGIVVDDRGSATKNEVRITRGMLASGYRVRNVDHDGASVSRQM
jgi:hypothetical protein